MSRRDGKRLKKVDSMHIIMPIMMPDRCDNEAYITEIIDLTKLNKFLAKKNKSNPEYEYKLFQVIVAAILKVLVLRPKMNRFIKNYKLYQRNDYSASFVIKKQFRDESEEGLAVVKASPEDTLDSIHDMIASQVMSCRGGKKDSSTESMDVLSKLPDFLITLIGYVVRFLDRHGWMPASVIETDPYQCSVILSNLGSIKLHSGYHHLTNWGTTSIFVVVGEIKKRLIYDEKCKSSVKDSIELGLVVDERIADGYYFSGTVRLFKKLIENPELLEKPLSTEVDY